MLNAKSDSSTLDVTASVNTEEAFKALSQSGDYYEASGQTDDDISLTITPISDEEVTFVTVHYVVQGASVTSYELLSTAGETVYATERRDIVPNVKTTVLEAVPGAVAARHVRIHARPTSQYVAVQISGVFVEACYETGTEYGQRRIAESNRCFYRGTG